MNLQTIAERLSYEGVFTGGPPHLFESAGRLQFATLIREGLWPDSCLLDIGCGALRAGYWLVRFLEPNCYYGIEPDRRMLDKGIEFLLSEDLLRSKNPHFDSNDGFDFSVFKVEFDVFLARSIWSHASKAQIQVMLDRFCGTASKNAFFLTSFLPQKWYRHDYRGQAWIGKSHQRREAGQVRHHFSWIEDECKSRHLLVQQLPDAPFNGQLWLKIQRSKPT